MFCTAKLMGCSNGEIAQKSGNIVLENFVEQLYPFIFVCLYYVQPLTNQDFSFFAADSSFKIMRLINRLNWNCQKSNQGLLFSCKHQNLKGLTTYFNSIGQSPFALFFNSNNHDTSYFYFILLASSFVSLHLFTIYNMCAVIIINRQIHRRISIISERRKLSPIKQV